MKIKRLDVRGFSHDVVLVFFVVIFAIGGVAYMVASRAYGCEEPVSGAVSSDVSGEASGPVSEDCPVSEVVSGVVSSEDEEAEGGIGGGGDGTMNSAPVAKTEPTTTSAPAAKTNSGTTQTNSTSTPSSNQKTVQNSRIATPTPTPTPGKITATPTATSAPAAKCVIAGVTPKPSYKQRISPSLYVTNSGSAPFRPSVSISATILGTNGKQIVNTTNKLLPLLASEQTESFDLGTYRIPFSTNQVTKISYTVTSTSPKFNCSATATLPKSSVWSSILGLFR